LLHPDTGTDPASAVPTLVPILPFLVTAGRIAVIASVGLSGLALFAIGAAITIFTGVTVGALEADNLHSVSELPV
jgi:VIT1/CCC1 family predicted Fe2+/Mn2+ transporter